MTDSSQWERAEAAFEHVQHAASEMIAAAHDALDLLDGVVSTADLRAVAHTFNDLSRSMFIRRRPRPKPDRSATPERATPERATTDPATTDPATTDPATTDPATTDRATTGQQPRARPHSPVQRISVR